MQALAALEMVHTYSLIHDKPGHFLPARGTKDAGLVWMKFEALVFDSVGDPSQGTSHVAGSIA